MWHLVDEWHICQFEETALDLLTFPHPAHKMMGVSMVVNLVIMILLSLVVAQILLSFWAHDLYLVVALDAAGS
jgi:hypothetical protein